MLIMVKYYQLPLAPPPPEDPPPNPPKLPPDEPLHPPPPLVNPEDLVFLGILTVFLSWKLQYLHILSTSLLPEEVYVAAFSTFDFMVSAQNLRHCGHLRLKRLTRKMIRVINRNTGKQHQHPVGIEEKKPPDCEVSPGVRLSIASSSSPYI